MSSFGYYILNGQLGAVTCPGSITGVFEGHDGLRIELT